MSWLQQDLQHFPTLIIQDSEVTVMVLVMVIIEDSAEDDGYFIFIIFL